MIVVIALVLLVTGIVGSSAVILPVVLGLLFACLLRPVSGWLRQRGAAVAWLTIDPVVDQWDAIEALILEGLSPSCAPPGSSGRR